MSEVVLSVGEFIALVNQTLEFAYPVVTVEGEITGYEIKQDKWIHFSLKDAEGVVACFMTVWNLKTPLADGMKVRVLAAPKLTQWGRFSLNVRSYELAGEGALRQAYELLKAKLEGEGLFDAARKRALPTYPATIGLITSTESEAYKDFIKILGERWGGVSVVVAPVQVQGMPAPEQIAGAIKYFNELAAPVDVLALVRGGGSLEDLQAFNAEPVVRAVAGSRTPIIVGVGHEGDVSLADLAADVRASTPTNAAQLVVPDRTEVLGRLDTLTRHLHEALSGHISEQQHLLNRQLNTIERFVRRPAERLISLVHGLRQAVNQTAAHAENQQSALRQLNLALVAGVQAGWQGSVQSLTVLERTLKSVDPSRVLKRGYAIARNGGKVVRSAADVKVGDELMLQLAKDQIRTEVKDGH